MAEDMEADEANGGGEVVGEVGEAGEGRSGVEVQYRASQRGIRQVEVEGQWAQRKEVSKVERFQWLVEE